jgi:hypothetical protein
MIDPNSTTPISDILAPIGDEISRLEAENQRIIDMQDAPSFDPIWAINAIETIIVNQTTLAALYGKMRMLLIAAAVQSGDVGPDSALLDTIPPAVKAALIAAKAQDDAAQGKR